MARKMTPLAGSLFKKSGKKICVTQKLPIYLGNF
jgi:hypothetical protein